MADTQNLHLAHFLGLGSEKKWYGTHSEKPDGKWDKTAEKMMLNFAQSGHPIFRATSALKRGALRSKGKGKKSIHFNGSEANIELTLRTVISVNQLVFSLSVIALTSPLSFNFARWFTTADNSVFTFVSVWTRHRSHDVLRLDDRHVPGVVVTCSATMFVGGPVCCHVSVLRHCA